jgi:hypothetical protein
LAVVPRCGERTFLRQFQNYRFNSARFESEPKVVLFERSSRYLVSMPRIEGAARRVKWKPPADGEVPF